MFLRTISLGTKTQGEAFFAFPASIFFRTYLGDANFAGRLLLHLSPPFGSGGVPFKRRRVSHFIFASPSAAGNLIEKGEEEAGKPDRTFCNTFPPSLRQAKVKEALWLPFPSLLSVLLVRASSLSTPQTPPRLKREHSPPLSVGRWRAIEAG